MATRKTAGAPRKRRAPKTLVLPQTVRALGNEARKAQRAFERASLLLSHQQQERTRKAEGRAAKVPARKPARKPNSSTPRRRGAPKNIPLDL